MPIGALGAAAIGLGSTIAGQGSNALIQGKSNKKTREWNEKMWGKQNQQNMFQWNTQNDYNEGLWNKQNAYNERMWQMMNERFDQVWDKENAYNSPQAMMQRFKEAGLNPNLIYGNGTTSGNISSGSMDTPMQSSGSIGQSSVQPWRPNVPTFDPMQGIMSGIALRQQSAQTNNLEALNNKINAETFKTYAETDLKNFDLSFQKEHRQILSSLLQGRNASIWADTEGKEQSNQFNEEINPTKLQAAQKQLDALTEQIKGQQKLNELRELEIKLNEAGFTKGDPVWARVIMRFLGELGINIGTVADMLK